MPFSINGIGTTYYGRRYFLPDDSYVTTEWVIFLYFPIVPLRSLRLRSDSTLSGVEDSNTGFAQPDKFLSVFSVSLW
ncbi:hypothetical protein CKA32_005054 [Geitlerinema sp. FC II]|nr:hypothetical protein CKA32_005054 [Geitlerinema sp. FC II]